MKAVIVKSVVKCQHCDGLFARWVLDDAGTCSSCNRRIDDRHRRDLLDEIESLKKSNQTLREEVRRLKIVKFR